MGIPALTAALEENKRVGIPHGNGCDPGRGAETIQKAVPVRVELQRQLALVGHEPVGIQDVYVVDLGGELIAIAVLAANNTLDRLGNPYPIGVRERVLGGAEEQHEG